MKKAEIVDFDLLEKELKRVRNRFYSGNDSKVIINAAIRLLEIKDNTCVFGNNCDAMIAHMKGQDNAKKKQ